MISLKTLATAAALIWTIAVYPIYPFLGLITALIAIGTFFHDEPTDKLTEA